jgi:hypothetical protein
MLRRLWATDSLSIVSLSDGQAPFGASAFVRGHATMGVADSAWATDMLGLQDAYERRRAVRGEEPADASGGRTNEPSRLLQDCGLEPVDFTVVSSCPDGVDPAP